MVSVKKPNRLYSLPWEEPIPETTKDMSFEEADQALSKIKN